MADHNELISLLIAKDSLIAELTEHVDHLCHDLQHLRTMSMSEVSVAAAPSTSRKLLWQRMSVQDASDIRRGRHQKSHSLPPTLPPHVDYYEQEAGPSKMSDKKSSRLHRLRDWFKLSKRKSHSDLIRREEGEEPVVLPVWDSPHRNPGSFWLCNDGKSGRWLSENTFRVVELLSMDIDWTRVESYMTDSDCLMLMGVFRDDIRYMSEEMLQELKWRAYLLPWQRELLMAQYGCN